MEAARNQEIDGDQEGQEALDAAAGALAATKAALDALQRGENEE